MKLMLYANYASFKKNPSTIYKKEPQINKRQTKRKISKTHKEALHKKRYQMANTQMKSAQSH